MLSSLLALPGWNLPWWNYVLIALVLTHVSIAAITIFLHRSQAHRAVELLAVVPGRKIAHGRCKVDFQVFNDRGRRHAPLKGETVNKRFERRAGLPERLHPVVLAFVFGAFDAPDVPTRASTPAAVVGSGADSTSIGFARSRRSTGTSLCWAAPSMAQTRLAACSSDSWR